MKQSIEELIENEWFIVRHSGETPEIAFHSAIYYLTRAKDGPGLQLQREQFDMLMEGAMTRFREIILRDLDHGNAEKPIYRGVKRSIVNYRRFLKFCSRQNIDEMEIRQETAQMLLRFIEQERAELATGERSSIINCAPEEMLNFARELGVCIGRDEEIIDLCNS